MTSKEKSEIAHRVGSVGSHHAISEMSMAIQEALIAAGLGHLIGKKVEHLSAELWALALQKCIADLKALQYDYESKEG
jgi:hypothetical protein